MFRRSPAEALQRDAGNVKMIRYYAQKYGVPEGLALSVAYQESRFDTCAGSHTGVKGVMQLTKGTGKSMGLDRDVNEQNVEGGVKYLGMGVKQCGATNYSCLASFYNGSNAAEQRAVGRRCRPLEQLLQRLCIERQGSRRRAATILDRNGRRRRRHGSGRRHGHGEEGGWRP